MTPIAVLQSILDCQSVSAEDITRAISQCQADNAEIDKLKYAVSSLPLMDENGIQLLDIAKRAAATHRRYKRLIHDGDDEAYDALDEMYIILEEFEKLDFGDIVSGILSH